MTTNKPKNPNSIRPTLIRLSSELAEAFEDYRHDQQKKAGRRVTKRELVEAALWRLIRNGAAA